MLFIPALVDKFWNPEIWLPPNTTWKDLKSNDITTYTEFSHLILPIPMAFIMLALRIFLERHWFAPVGVSLGLKSSRPKRAPSNTVLERAYQANRKIKYREVVALAKQLDWSERQVERWIRLRKSQNKPSTLTKFTESGWRCLYYSYSFIYGLICLWEKPWLWDIKHSWYNYPHQGLTSDIWFYYMISLAFYWSLAVSQFFDVKRNDFWQMFVHHIATICLLSFSWMCNLFRIGTLVLLVHDCADIFLEAAKMAKYAKYQQLCDCLFVIFTCIWIITRLGFFPMWIIYSTVIDAPKLVSMFPAYYIFNGLLILLLVLHCFWTYVILKIAYKAVVAGQMEGDIRSSSEEDISDDQPEQNDPSTT